VGELQLSEPRESLPFLSLTDEALATPGCAMDPYAMEALLKVPERYRRWVLREHSRLMEASLRGEVVVEDGPRALYAKIAQRVVGRVEAPSE
jgi:hypothetical protein